MLATATAAKSSSPMTITYFIAQTRGSHLHIIA
jgi:hypothetical protein